MIEPTFIIEKNMKNLDTTKLTVLTLGVLTIMAALTGALYGVDPKVYAFALYIGLTLTGTVLLHKETEAKSIKPET